MADCVFCKIIKGEIPSYKLYEDDNHLAFLDSFPATEGQALVVPKKPVGYLFDLSEADIVALFKVVRKVARAMDKALKPIRTCVVVEGFYVKDHVHVRLHPCYEEKLEFAPMPKPAPERFAAVAERIRKGIKG